MLGEAPQQKVFFFSLRYAGSDQAEFGVASVTFHLLRAS